MYLEFEKFPEDFFNLKPIPYTIKNGEHLDLTGKITHMTNLKTITASLFFDGDDLGAIEGVVLEDGTFRFLDNWNEIGGIFGTFPFKYPVPQAGETIDLFLEYSYIQRLYQNAIIVGKDTTTSPEKSEPKPEQIMCTQQYDPVCGVDGRTYGNQCTLNSNGIELDYTGECLKFEPTTKRELELGIASFVEKSKDPQFYIDRYNNEPEYKEWFDENYPEYDSIEQAVGLELTAKIPDWIKNVFLWYAQDQISENELLDAIKYLIDEGILIVD
jgi:hypothetical protein